MNAPVHVRRATLEDLSQVMRLERDSSGAPHWNEQVYRAMLEGATDAPERKLFVVAGESIEGFVAGAVIDDEAELESIVVEEDLRRRGVGRALMQAVMGWACKAGAGTMRLEVRAANVGAQALYRRLGFAEAGLRRGYYHDPADDAVVMTVKLVDADL